MMKFKMFEKLDPDYVEIDSEEYWSYDNTEDLTPREFSDIRKFLASKGISLYYVPGTEYTFPKRQVPGLYFIFKYRSDRTAASVTVRKLEDNWFLVTLGASIENSVRIRSQKYFKCDQMEGLMFYLREILKMIPDQDPNILISHEDKRSSLEELRKEVYKKVRILSFEDLSKLNDTLQ